MSGQTNNNGTRHTFVAAAAIVANRALKMNSSGEVLHTTAITDDVIGFATETVAIGERVVVECGNRLKRKVVAGAAMATVGVQVMPLASGDGKITAAAGATAKSCGILLSAAAADGEVVEILTSLSLNGPANS